MFARPPWDRRVSMAADTCQAARVEAAPVWYGCIDRIVERKGVWRGDDLRHHERAFAGSFTLMPDLERAVERAKVG